MDVKFADWFSAALCALYVGCLCIVASGYQAGVRQLLGSEVTAAWVGAIGTIGAVFSGFWLARKQAAEQARQALAAEHRAIAARLRAAAMLMKNTHTHVAAVVRAAHESPQPRAYIKVVLDSGLFKSELQSALAGIDVGTMPVPGAVDAITAGRAMFSLLLEKMRSFAADEKSPAEMEELFKASRAFSAYFATLALLSQHFEPNWPDVPNFHVDDDGADPFSTSIQGMNSRS
jgi:hypothetical protein